jgi:hypothetical protein
MNKKIRIILCCGSVDRDNNFIISSSRWCRTSWRIIVATVTITIAATMPTLMNIRVLNLFFYFISFFEATSYRVRSQLLSFKISCLFISFKNKKRKLCYNIMFILKPLLIAFCYDEWNDSLSESHSKHFR